MSNDPNWKVYADPNINLRDSWKERVCPGCNIRGFRHSIGIIIPKAGYLNLPDDLCTICATRYMEFSELEW